MESMGVLDAIIDTMKRGEERGTLPPGSADSWVAEKERIIRRAEIVKRLEGLAKDYANAQAQGGMRFADLIALNALTECGRDLAALDAEEKTHPPKITA